MVIEGGRKIVVGRQWLKLNRDRGYACRGVVSKLVGRRCFGILILPRLLTIDFCGKVWH
jgi:hypothetical protein